VSCNLLVLLLPLQLWRRLVLEDIRHMPKELDVGEAFSLSLSLFQRETSIAKRASGRILLFFAINLFSLRSCDRHSPRL
jgi:hypothetical protein